MDIQAAESLAIKLMIQHHLFPVWEFAFSRSIVDFGLCFFEERRIALSKALTIINEEKEVRDTILHEIAHALVGRKSEAHGPEWRAKAIAIGARPEAQYNPEAIVVPPYKWVGTTKHCNHIFFRYRRNDLICGFCTDKIIKTRGSISSKMRDRYRIKWSPNRFG